MSDEQPLSEFLVLSRGRWDADKSPEQIQEVIEAFYAWHEGLVKAGKAKPGQRLAVERKFVSKWGITDGPFSESKEVIGGYWFFFARNLEEAVALAAQNPTIACGLSFEVGPIERQRANAYTPANETPRKLNK
jgi:hypothetical protein